MRMSNRSFGPDSGPGLTGGVNVGMRPDGGPGLTGGVNVGMRPDTPVRRPLPILTTPSGRSRDLRVMVPGSQIMPHGRAYKNGGMVGCDWSPKSSKTMRGAARKGK